MATKKNAPAKKAAPKKSTAKKAAPKKAAPEKKNKLGVKNSLVNNINAKKKKGASKSQAKSTVSKKNYKDMEDNWGKDKSKISLAVLAKVFAIRGYVLIFIYF